VWRGGFLSRRTACRVGEGASHFETGRVPREGGAGKNVPASLDAARRRAAYFATLARLPQSFMLHQRRVAFFVVSRKCKTQLSHFRRRRRSARTPTFDQLFLDRPGNDAVQLELFYSYASTWRFIHTGRRTFARINRLLCWFGERMIRFSRWKARRLFSMTCRRRRCTCWIPAILLWKKRAKRLQSTSYDSSERARLRREPHLSKATTGKIVV
jgi:hypothetical protein